MPNLGQYKTILNNPNPSGLFFCGCGKKTPISNRNTYISGLKIGCPIKFILGHNGMRNTKYLLPYRGCNKGKHYGPMSEVTKKKIGIANSGSKSHLWKGGITSKDRLERVKFRIKIQKKVFERDNYTCQICGERGGRLQVDHIQSWAEYVELRFNIENCRTLCMECHYGITFGKPMPLNIKSWGHNLLIKTI